jgi:hypothetical protein
MLVIGRAARAVCAAGAVLAFAACSSPDKEPEPAPPAVNLDANAIRTALLKPAEVGPTWKDAPTARPQPLVALCAGGEDAPPVPGAPSVVSAPLVDEGRKGVQSLDQVALVYRSAVEATAGLAALRVSADACARTVDVPAQETEQRREPAYTETLAIAPLTSGQWTGFVVERHKVYDPKHPAAADTAVAVLSLRNVLLVDAYAVHVLGARTAAPQFTADWRKLVGTTVNRVKG